MLTNYRLLEFGSINCVRHVSKRKYKLQSSNQSILSYLYCQTYQNRNNSWKSECVLRFKMGRRILVNFIRQPMLKLKTHSGFHDLFLKQKKTKTCKTCIASPIFKKKSIWNIRKRLLLIQHETNINIYNGKSGLQENFIN